MSEQQLTARLRNQVGGMLLEIVQLSSALEDANKRIAELELELEKKKIEP